MKYIILDFGNVLVHPTTGKWFLTPAFYKAVDIEKIDMNKVRMNTLDASHFLNAKMLTLEEELLYIEKYYAGLLKETGFEDKAKEIAYDFVYNNGKYTLYSTVKDELKKLSKNYKLFVLSDNWPCGERIINELGLDKYFEKVYISSHYKEVKIEGKFFDRIIKDYDIKDGEAIFVDDNIDILDVASEKGLKCYLMDRQSVTKPTRYPVINNLYDLVEEFKIHL